MDHSDKKLPIRGKVHCFKITISWWSIIWFRGDRLELAKECLLTTNGSPFNFVNNKIAAVVKDDEGNDDIAILPGQVGKFRRIVSKCVTNF